MLRAVVILWKYMRNQYISIVPVSVLCSYIILLKPENKIWLQIVDFTEKITIYAFFLSCLGYIACFLVCYIIIYILIELIIFFYKKAIETQKKIDMQQTVSLTTNTGYDNLINYDNAINLIKKSLYGAYKIAEAVKNGTIKETGGYNYIERTGLAALTGGQIERKKPTADEELENIKQQKIYDDILQEFCKKHGFYNKNNEYKEKNNQYSTLSMFVNKDDLDIFLRNKK